MSGELPHPILPALPNTRPTKRTRGYYEPGVDDIVPPFGVPSHNILSIEETSEFYLPTELQFEEQKREEEREEAKNAEVSKTIADIQGIYTTTKDQIEKIKWSQKQLKLPVNIYSPEYEGLAKQQKTLIGFVQWSLTRIKELLNSYIIHPRELAKAYVLRRDLQILEATLNLYQSELVNLTNPDAASKCFASLLVSKQPFPKPIKKESKIGPTDPVVVTLITSPNSEVVPIGKIKANLLYEDFHAKKDSLVITNDSQELGPTGDAAFTEMRFPTGTRLKMVRVQFTGEFRHGSSFGGSTGVSTIESEPTSPFVVMTNENQWEQSAGVLLKKETFESQGEVPWQLFANNLQLHYLRATRQSLDNPSRVLSKDDLDYIFSTKFEGKAFINQKEYEEFWDWFGKALHKIRHQKHFSSLWLRGFIYGFVSKPEAERLLSVQRPGSFILRFSDSTPGKLAVAYVKTDPMTGRVEIKHYMIDPHAEKQETPLPDFLATHENLVYWLQIKNDFIPGPQKLQNIYEKHVVLRDYLVKKESNSTIEGYEEVLE